MKKDTKIFITCLVVGLWLLNLSMVTVTRWSPNDPIFDLAAGLVGMLVAIKLLTLQLKD